MPMSSGTARRHRSSDTRRAPSPRSRSSRPMLSRWATTRSRSRRSARASRRHQASGLRSRPSTRRCTISAASSRASPSGACSGCRERARRPRGRCGSGIPTTWPGAPNAWRPGSAGSSSSSAAATASTSSGSGPFEASPTCRSWSTSTSGGRSTRRSTPSRSSPSSASSTASSRSGRATRAARRCGRVPRSPSTSTRTATRPRTCRGAPSSGTG